MEKLICMQKEKLAELIGNVHAFTLSFDYRNAGKKLSEKEQSSVADAAKHLTKY